MKAVIVCGGIAPSKELLMKELIDSSYLICADSGADCIYEYGIKPDFIIGDMDSIKKETLDYFAKENVNINIYPKEKDETDSELAINKAVQLESDEIVFLGCMGTRLDHVIGNMGLLKICLKYKIKAFIKDENNTVFLTDKNIVLENEPGEIFSLQSFGTDVKKISIEGAKYKLSNYNLSFGDPLTISNEFLEKEVKITFDSGVLLVFYSKNI